MNNKLIVFDNENINEMIGDVKYVKFLSDNSAIFYNPLIAPKYLDEYIKENNIVKAYEIKDDIYLEEYNDFIYTFAPNKGVYNISKGIDIEDKYILLVDKGMEIETDLKVYSYTFKNNKFYVKELSKKPNNKDYCYVCSGINLNDELKKIMIPVYEAVPNILSVNKYNFKHNIKTKKYELKKKI